MGKSKNFWDSLKRNEISYTYYYRRLLALCISTFEWKNLPPSVDERFLELTLYGMGQAVFFKDDVLGFLALQCAAGGQVDIYRVPTIRRAYAANGYNQTLNPDNSVIIYNDYLRLPSIMTVEYYAEKLYQIDRTIEINVATQKTPLLLLCDENERLTMKNLYSKYSGNEPVIMGNNNLKPDSIKVINTDAPYVADKLFQLKVQTWNEALTALGITNSNIIKRERLVSEEAMQNEGGVIASRYSKLLARQQACEKINSMFGLKIEVDYRADTREEMMSDEEGKEWRTIQPN